MESTERLRDAPINVLRGGASRNLIARAIY